MEATEGVRQSTGTLEFGLWGPRGRSKEGGLGRERGGEGGPEEAGVLVQGMGWQGPPDIAVTNPRVIWGPQGDEGLRVGNEDTRVSSLDP